MKNVKKALLVCLCLCVVVALTVAGTLAFLTDTQEVVNTFTVGNVDITVDEAKVNTDGTPVTGADRVTGNEYHLIPGQTYTKDPTMTVEAESEAAYVRMLVTMTHKTELDDIRVSLSMLNGWDRDTWIYKSTTVDTTADTVTYEFWYKEAVAPNGEDVVLDALFDSFTLPGTLDGDDLKSIEGLEITVVGHAIQAAGFENADAAWTAFNSQINK